MKFLLLLGFCAAMLPGQPLRLSDGKAFEPAGLHPRPDRNSPTVYQVAAGSALRVLEGSAKNGFLRVLPERGPAGWVAAETVKITGDFTATGCPPADDSAKKRQTVSTGNVTILDFNDILKLQLRAERLVGMGREVSRDDRAKLLPNGAESLEVRVSGYLAAKSDMPRVAGDCVGGRSDDWLLSITPDSGSKDFQGLLARVAAAKRNPKWTLEQLRFVREKQFPVLVTGFLYYDGTGLVNDDSGNPIPRVLPRAWLWELRSVTSMLVCTGGDCEVGSSKGWVSLETISVK